MMAMRRRNSEDGDSAPKRLFTHGELSAALREVARAAHDRGRIALAGGVAMQLYGSSRLTADLDVLCECELTGLTEVGRLSFGGQKLVSANGVPVDVIIRNDEMAALYEAALESAQHIAGVDDAKVVRPEYLVAMKMWAGRADKDIPDIQHLLASGAADMDGASKVVRRYLGVYAVKELASMRDEIEWLKASGRWGAP